MKEIGATKKELLLFFILILSIFIFSGCIGLNNGRVSCISEPNCLAGHLLNNGVCLKCGEANLPCCDKDAAGYECEENLSCNLGFCGKNK